MLFVLETIENIVSIFISIAKSRENINNLHTTSQNIYISYINSTSDIIYFLFKYRYILNDDVALIMILCRHEYIDIIVYVHCTIYSIHETSVH